MGAQPDNSYNLALRDLGVRGEKLSTRLEQLLLQASSFSTHLEGHKATITNTVAAALNSLTPAHGANENGDPVDVLSQQLAEQKDVMRELKDENRGLSSTLDEYQVAMDLLMQRHRAYKEQYEQELRKMQRQQPIEQLLNEEKVINEQLRAENAELYGQVQSMFDVIRRAAAEDELDEQDLDSYTLGLMKENEGLREILNLSQADEEQLLSSVDHSSDSTRDVPTAE